MLQQVVDLFGITVDHNLDIMTQDQTLAGLTARLMIRLDEFLAKTDLDLALVQGDTTTVMTSALSCFYNNIPVGHIEAGLRTSSIQAPWPEEANRRLTSQISTLHFAPTVAARENLIHAGIDKASVVVTGNTVIDALFLEIERQKDPAVDHDLEETLDAVIENDWNKQPFVLVTGHRRENFGDGFMQICQALKTLSERYTHYNFIYPVHLNPNVLEPVHSILGKLPNVRLLGPQEYSLFVKLMRSSHIILTDSGGVQEEAPSLGKPVLVMRDETERPEGVEAGTVKLVGPHADRIISEIAGLIDDEPTYRKMAEARNPYGDGTAATQILKRIDEYFST